MLLCARNHLPVRLWLVGMAIMTLAMVLLGGATRLTGSGLSITQWQVVLGSFPPLTEVAWERAFALYRSIPQFQFVNSDMTLEGFKTIYWWEWSHRFLGRLLGLVALLPLIVFWWRDAFSTLSSKVTFAFIPLLVALQGALGWYMVRSGLVDRVSVSPHRLAAHLLLASALLGYLTWLFLSLTRSRSLFPTKLPSGFLPALLLSLLIFVQIAAGAFVAGHQAGMGYNTWPLMDGALVPDGLFAVSPWWRNLFENALTVQFQHRMLAYFLVLFVSGYVVKLLWTKTLPHCLSSALWLLGTVWAQLFLGIATLLYHVPLPLALLHQGLAIVVFVTSLFHLHVRVFPHVPLPQGP